MARLRGIRSLRIEQNSHAGRRIEPHHQLIGLAVGVAQPEAEVRLRLEDQPHLGLGVGQQLARADEERHARPTPVLDLEAQGAVGLGCGVGGDAVDLAIPLELAANVMLRVRVTRRAVQQGLHLLDRVEVAVHRRLHRDRGEHLHEVVDDDVAQRADRIVEVAAVGDAEVLGHRDLHAVDVVAVPHRLEHRVREPQVQDLLEAHLAEVVVDPEDLRLVDVLVQVGGERPGRRRGRGRTASR